MIEIRTWGFWERGQQAFFDIRVSDPNACCYRNKSLQQCHVIIEQEKKRAYNERILQVDHGTFPPLVFSITFYSRLAQLRDLPQSISSNWIRTKVCFVLLKSSRLCLRGLRTVCRETVEFEIDVNVSHAVCRQNIN